MFTLVVAPFFFLYCYLAITFVRWVFFKTERHRSRVITIVFVVLLPTWDVLLSASCLPFALVFWPKQQIINKIKVNSILYEGNMCGYLQTFEKQFNNNTTSISLPGCAYAGLERLNLKFAEEIVSREGDRHKHTILPKGKNYRCYPLKKSSFGNISANCSEVTSIISMFSIHHSSYDVLYVRLEEVNIHNVESLECSAISRVVKFRGYASFILIPFFSWTGWGKLFHGGDTYIYDYPRVIFGNFIYEALGLL